MSGAIERMLSVAQELAEVSRLVEDDDVKGALARFVARVVGTVPGCAEATITVRSDGGVETVAAVELDGIAEEPHPDADPILEALRHREPRRIEDTATDQRWPVFSARLAQLGYRSCLALPVPAKRTASTVLTLFSRSPHQFDETGYDIVLLLTLHAGVVFDNAQLFHDSRSLVEQLNTALDTRQSIGQAQGLLMRHYSVGGQASFQMLKSASQNTNSKLRNVAFDLVAAHERGALEAAIAAFGIDPDKAPAPVASR